MPSASASPMICEVGDVPPDRTRGGWSRQDRQVVLLHTCCNLDGCGVPIWCVNNIWWHSIPLIISVGFLLLWMANASVAAVFRPSPIAGTRHGWEPLTMAHSHAINLARSDSRSDSCSASNIFLSELSFFMIPTSSLTPEYCACSETASILRRSWEGHKSGKSSICVRCRSSRIC